VGARMLDVVQARVIYYIHIYMCIGIGMRHYSICVLYVMYIRKYHVYII
jgi:hypothetical protein